MLNKLKQNESGLFACIRIARTVSLRVRFSLSGVHCSNFRVKLSDRGFSDPVAFGQKEGLPGFAERKHKLEIDGFSF